MGSESAQHPPLRLLLKVSTQGSGKEFKGSVECMSREVFFALTIRQRTADWEVVRQMGCTASAACGEMMYMQSLKFSAPPARSGETATTFQSCLSGFTQSKIFRKKSMEGMIPCTINEQADMSFLHQQRWLHYVYNISMLCTWADPTIYASPYVM